MKKAILFILVVVMLLAVAGCAPKTYEVTFDTDGGSPVATQVVYEGSKAVRPEKPTKEGFEFDNWYTAKTGGEAFGFDKPISADVTVYARWKAETITEDKKAVQLVVSYLVDDPSLNTELTVNTFEGDPLPNLDNRYFDVLDYYTDAECTKEYESTTVDADTIRLYAKVARKATITEGNFVYSLREDGRTYRIAENKENPVNVLALTLPAKISVFDVVAIAERGFMFCSVEKLVIPEGYVEIEESAFLNNDNIVMVDFPSSLKEIGDDAFFNARALLLANLAEGLEIIGQQAFEDTGLRFVIIPATVKEIKAGAFSISQPDEDTKVLEEVIFMGIVAPHIENGAFGTVRRDYLYVEGALDPIGQILNDAGAVGRSYYLDERLKYQGRFTPAEGETFGVQLHLSGSYLGVFETADSYTVIEMMDVNTFIYYGDGSVEQRKVAILDNETFTYQMLTPDEDGYIIKENVLYDYVGDDWMFTVPDNVTEIGIGAVQANMDIRVIMLGDQVTKVGDMAFAGCIYVYSIHFGTNIEYIGYQSFTLMKGLVEIRFVNSDSAPYIGEAAFYVISGIMLAPTSVSWGGFMNIYHPNVWSARSLYRDAFNANNKAQDSEGNTVGAYDSKDFVGLGSEAGSDYEGKTYALDGGGSIWLSGGDTAILEYIDNGETKYQYGLYRYEDVFKVTIRASFVMGLGGETVYYYGKINNDNFQIRDNVFGTYNDDSITITLDGYGKASAVIDGQTVPDADYTFSGTIVNFTGIDGLASAAYAAASGDQPARLSLTMNGKAHTLIFTGVEVGKYYDIANAASLTLDGQGNLVLVYKGVSYERKYENTGKKIIITWQEDDNDTPENEQLLWEYDYSSKDFEIKGYWNRHEKEYYYNTYFTFVPVVVNAEKGSYSSVDGATLELDGFFLATLTENDIETKYDYLMIRDNSLALFNADSNKIILLDGATFAEVNTGAESVAGQYFVANTNYKVWIDGNGGFLYSNGLQRGTYEIEGEVFKLTMKDKTHETGVYNAEKQFIETAFDYYGWNYMRLFKTATASAYFSTTINTKSVTVVVCDNGTAYGYEYGEPITVWGSVTDFAVFKTALDSKQAFEITIDGKIYTAAWDADNYRWTLTEKEV